MAYNDSLIGKRSQLAAEKTEEHMGLTTVKQVQFEKEFNLKEIRIEIKRRHDLTMKQFQPKSFDDYLKAMETNGVKVIPTINNQNKLQGFRFNFDGYNLKCSEMHCNMSVGNIEKQLSKIQDASIFKENNASIKLARKNIFSKELCRNIYNYIFFLFTLMKDENFNMDQVLIISNGTKGKIKK